MAGAIVHLPDAMEQVTLKFRVTGAKQLAARVWLGSQFIKIAARVMGCAVDIEIQR